MTDAAQPREEPATEAGRRLLAQVFEPDHAERKPWIEWILAIEAEAAARSSHHATERLDPNDDEHWHRGPSANCRICTFGAATDTPRTDERTEPLGVSRRISRDRASELIQNVASGFSNGEPLDEGRLVRACEAVAGSWVDDSQERGRFSPTVLASRILAEYAARGMATPNQDAGGIPYWPEATNDQR